MKISKFLFAHLSVTLLLIGAGSFLFSSNASASEGVNTSHYGNTCISDHWGEYDGNEQECLDDHPDEYCDYHDCGGGGYGGGGGGGGGQCNKPIFSKVSPVPNAVLNSLKKITFVTDKKPTKTTVKIDNMKANDIIITQKPNGKWKVVAKFDNIIDGGQAKIFIHVKVKGGCKKTLTYFVTIGDGTDDDDDHDAPTCSIWAEPSSIMRGKATKLRWTTIDAEKAMIKGRRVRVPNGMRWVAPKKTTTYTMSVWGEGGSGDCEVIVEVTKKAPKPYCEIWASPTTVKAGGKSTLTWNATNATGAWLEENSYVNASGGSVDVYPQRTNTFTMAVWNDDGKVSRCKVKVKVKKKRYGWKKMRSWRSWRNW